MPSAGWGGGVSTQPHNREPHWSQFCVLTFFLFRCTALSAPPSDSGPPRSVFASAFFRCICLPVVCSSRSQMDVKKSMAAHYKRELESGKIRGTGRALTAEERAHRFAVLRARAEFLRGRYRNDLLDELKKLEEAGVPPVQEDEEPAREQQVRDRKRRVNEAAEGSDAKKVSKKGMSAIEGTVEIIGAG